MFRKPHSFDWLSEHWCIFFLYIFFFYLRTLSVCSPILVSSSYVSRSSKVVKIDFGTAPPLPRFPFSFASKFNRIVARRRSRPGSSGGNGRTRATSRKDPRRGRFCWTFCLPARLVRGTCLAATRGVTRSDRRTSRIRAFVMACSFPRDGTRVQNRREKQVPTEKRKIRTEKKQRRYNENRSAGANHFTHALLFPSPLLLGGKLIYGRKSLARSFPRDNFCRSRFKRTTKSAHCTAVAFRELLSL